MLFSLMYIFKVLYTENLGWVMGRQWEEYILFYMSYVFIPYLFYSSIDIGKYKRTIINAIILSGFLLGVLTIFFYRDVILSGDLARISMLSSETGQEVISPLALSYSGALTILFCFYEFTHKKFSMGYKIYLLLTFSVSIMIFLLGATRGALLVILLAVMVFVYFGNIKRKLTFLVLFVLSIPVMFYGIEITGSKIIDRSLDSIKTGDTSGRELLWKDAFNEFIDFPLFGGRIEVSGFYPHNIFLEILMATGVIGMVLFSFLLFSSLINGFKLVKQNYSNQIVFLVFVCGFAQHFVTGALWGAIMLFASLGMMNSKTVD